MKFNLNFKSQKSVVLFGRKDDNIMIKQYVTIEQLGELSNYQLLLLAEKCHISSSKDIDTDEKSLWEFQKFMKGQPSIGRLIQLLINEKFYISWNFDSNDSLNSLIVENQEFRYIELSDCLWNAVKCFVLNIQMKK